MIKKTSRTVTRNLRKIRTAKKVLGSTQKPRLVVFKSLTQVYAQLIDDINGKTVVSASSLEKGIKDKTKKRTQKAQLVGYTIAERAISQGIKEVAFDRAGYKYHGVIAALADAAREKGLVF
jgi:large subunit ribosomal protein L18